MHFRNPHFKYSKNQRSGVFVFLTLIFLFQLGYYFSDYLYGDSVAVVNDQLKKYQQELDSLVKNKKSVPKRIYKVNPNFLSDAKGYQLGLSVEEIDKLFAYREKGLWVNSMEDFVEVTKVSDSLSIILKEYFRFPGKRIISEKEKPKKYSKILIADLNTVTALELEEVKGVGKVLSNRIVKYRNLLGGYSNTNQLYEVWGLDSLVTERVLERYSVLSKPALKKINVNTASFKELLAVVYLNYDLTKKILNYRKKIGKIVELNELKKIEGFPIEKYDRIALYLHAK